MAEDLQLAPWETGGDHADLPAAPWETTSPSKDRAETAWDVALKGGRAAGAAALLPFGGWATDPGLRKDVTDIAQQGVEATLHAPEQILGAGPSGIEEHRPAMEKIYRDAGYSEEAARNAASKDLKRLRRREGITNLITGPGTVALSPLMGAFRSGVSRPAEELTGAPHEAIEQVAMAGLAAAGLPGIRRAGTTPAVPKPGASLEGEVFPPPPPPPSRQPSRQGPIIDLQAEPRQGLDPNVKLIPADTLHSYRSPAGSVGAARTSSVLDTLSPEAREALQEHWEAQGFTPYTIEDAIESDSPHTFLGETTSDMARRMQGLVTIPGRASNEITQSVRQRHREAPERVTSEVDDKFGEPRNVEEWKAAIKADRARESNPFWRNFEALKITPTPELDELIPAAAETGAIAKANKNLRIERKPFQDGFPEDASPEQQQRYPTARAWQLVSEELWDDYASAKRAGRDNEARRIAALRSDIQNAIDNHPDPAIAGAWKVARDTWAGPSGVLKAQEFGRDILSGKYPPDVFDEMWDGMSQQNRDAAIIGLRYDLERAAGKKGNPELRANRILQRVNSPDNERIIRKILGDDRADEFFDMVQHEARMKGAQDFFIGNAQTAMRLGYRETWMPKTEGGPFDLGRKILGFVKSPIKGAAEFAEGKLNESEAAKAERVRDELSRVYTLQGPERDAVRRELTDASAAGMGQAVPPAAPPGATPPPPPPPGGPVAPPAAAAAAGPRPAGPAPRPAPAPGGGRPPPPPMTPAAGAVVEGLAKAGDSPLRAGEKAVLEIQRNAGAEEGLPPLPGAGGVRTEPGATPGARVQTGTARERPRPVAGEAPPASGVSPAAANKRGERARPGESLESRIAKYLSKGQYKSLTEENLRTLAEEGTPTVAAGARAGIETARKAAADEWMRNPLSKIPDEVLEQMRQTGRGLTPEQEAAVNELLTRPQRQPLVRETSARGRGNRPTRTEPMKGADEAILEAGYERATAGAQEAGLPGRGRVPGGAEQLEAPGGANRAAGELPPGEPLSGLPTRVTVPGIGKIDVGPHQPIRDLTRQYMAESGLPYNPPRDYAKVDVDRARRIADEYDKMAHAPDDPEVKAAYDAMAKETMAQWEVAKRAGLKVEFIPPGSPDPYAASPRLAIEDIKKNHHMWVFSTRDGFGSLESFDPSTNPLLAETGETISGKPALVNDIFRIVHDYFGHAKEGVGFRADGEENAWRSHAAMYSPLARKAMTSETRGQNSWLNYGPYGDSNRAAKTENTVFADQKTGVLPDWVVNEGSGQEGPARQTLPKVRTRVEEPAGDVEEHPDRIGQRIVTSKKAQPEPNPENLRVSVDALKPDQRAYGRQVDLLRDLLPRKYQGMADLDRVSQAFIDHVASNLKWLHDLVPQEIRDRSKLWYDGGNAIVKDWANEYGVKDSAVAGAIAALSPRMDWFKNVSLAGRVLHTLKGMPSEFYDNFKTTPEMRQAWEVRPALAVYKPLMDRLEGKSLNDIDRMNLPEDDRLALKSLWVRLYDEGHHDRSYHIITPEGTQGDKVMTQKGVPATVSWFSLDNIGKAIRSIESNGDQGVLHRTLGDAHKVRNFYNNLLEPNSALGDVTIDTHAVAAGLLKSVSGESPDVLRNFGSYPGKGLPATADSKATGVQGHYPFFADAYRKAAAELGILPRELQSITWEAVRSLFQDTQKARLEPITENIWQAWRKGKISTDEARQQILKVTGAENGLEPPAWAERNGETPTARRGANDARKLSQSGVPRQTAEGTGRGGRGAAAGEREEEVTPKRASGGRVDYHGRRGGHAVPPPLSTRKESNYSPTRGHADRHCGPDKKWPTGHCAMFRGPHSCTAVGGFIAARGGCDWYEDARAKRAAGGRLERAEGGNIPDWLAAQPEVGGDESWRTTPDTYEGALGRMQRTGRSPEVRAYEPTWRDRIAGALLPDNPSYKARQIVEETLGSSGIGSTGSTSAVDLAPIAGNVLGAQEAYQRGDIPEMGGQVAGAAIPGSYLASKVIAPVAKPVIRAGVSALTGAAAGAGAGAAALPTEAEAQQKRLIEDLSPTEREIYRRLGPDEKPKWLEQRNKEKKILSNLSPAEAAAYQALDTPAERSAYLSKLEDKKTKFQQEQDAIANAAKLQADEAARVAKLPFRERYPLPALGMNVAGVGLAGYLPYRLTSKSNIASTEMAKAMSEAADRVKAAIGAGDVTSARVAANELTEKLAGGPQQSLGRRAWEGTKSAAAGITYANSAFLPWETGIYIPNEFDYNMHPEGDPVRERAKMELSDPGRAGFNIGLGVGAGTGAMIVGNKAGHIRFPRVEPDTGRARAMIRSYEQSFPAHERDPFNNPAPPVPPAPPPPMPPVETLPGYTGPHKGAAETGHAARIRREAQERFDRTGSYYARGGGVGYAGGGRVEPTDAQKEAGNYQKDHVRVHGLEIAIENRKGATRRGVGKDGKPWSVQMPYHYGYIKRTEGADGDHLDVCLGPHLKSDKVWVVDQRDADTKRFDEHKVFIGWGNEAQVRAHYAKGFSDGRGHQRIQKITEMSIEHFKHWLKNGDTTRRMAA